MFSERTDRDTTPNALTRAIAARRASGASVVDLTASNPTALGLPYDDDAILAALADRRALAYEPEPFGLRSAREAVAAHLREVGASVDPDRIVITASTSEAYAFLLHVLADPGDEILVPAPSYPLLAEHAMLAGVSLATYPLVLDGVWSIDAEALYEAASERTRAIVVVSPNHPTGHFLDDETMAVLSELDLPIVADEVFARYPLEPREGALRSILAHPIFGTDDAPLTIALEGLSKTAALPQMKLAWMAIGGREDRAAPLLARLEHVADAFLSVGAPVQHALPSLLAASTITRDAIIARSRSNLATLRAALAGSACDVPRVEGGWYACVRLPATKTDEAWALALLDRGVLVSPGYFFDFPRGAWLVVSLIAHTNDVAEGARVLRELVDTA